MLAMNVQILRHTEYKNTSTEPPQILLSDLRFYCPTSEFTVRPQNLQYDLRIYSTTSESTVRPQNLQYDLRIYSTTSEFYCPTWVFGSSNFSTTWPGGSVLISKVCCQINHNCNQTKKTKGEIQIATCWRTEEQGRQKVEGREWQKSPERFENNFI